MMSTQWDFDDDTVPSDDTLLRRVPRNNPQFLTSDLITNQPTVHPAAFRYTGDGMSVSRLALLAARGQTPADLPWPADRYVIAQFSVATVRSAGGVVVDKVDPDDPVTGHAHALVRTKAPPPDRPVWSDVREAILLKHGLIDLLSE